MKYSEETINKIVKLRQEGYGVVKIANMLNLSRDAVSKNLKKLGFTTERNPIIRDIFRVIDTEEKSYWLGFLMADGYISKNGQVEVSLQLSDYLHLEKLKTFLNTNTSVILDERHNRCRLLFCNNNITQDLQKYGCVNNKSLILQFPTVEMVPDSLLNHFIRGYVDGDGCICCTDKTKSFSITSTPDFLEGMLTRTGWNPDKCNYYPSGKALTWRSHLNEAYKQLHYLYDNSNIYLERKFKKFLIFTAV